MNDTVKVIRNTLMLLEGFCHSAVALTDQLDNQPVTQAQIDDWRWQIESAKTCATDLLQHLSPEPASQVGSILTDRAA
jgi:hypothetical protein